MQPQRRSKPSNTPPPHQPNYNYGQPYPYDYDPGYAPQANQPNQPYGMVYPQGMPQWPQQAPPGYGAPPPGPPGNYVGQQFVNDQMAAMAMQYGQVLAGQGKDIVQQKMEKYVTFFARLKYYFAVDTAYVAKKIGLLFFPFAHKDFAVHFNQDEPVAPRYDINAPDLYIPAMAFVTYILTAGYLLGLQNKFSPEQLGKQASSAFGWVALEIIIVLLTHYLLSVSSSSLKFLDMVAFCSYKFTCIIATLLVSLPLGSLGYLCVLIYSTCSLGFFLMRTLRVAMLTKAADYTGGSKRTLYLVGLVCVLQPLMMYWLTYHLVYVKAPESI